MLYISNNASMHSYRYLFIYTDHKGYRLNLTLVQYVLSSEQVLDIKPHGNSKTQEPYFRTSVSTIKSLKTSIKNTSPKDALEKVSAERGGEMAAKSAGSLPRNRQQVYNIKRQLRPADPVYNLILEMQNLDQSNDFFVRELKLSPEPSVIMASDHQIAEVEAFCTNPDYHCVLGIDPTFNLGRFNLTVTTYKQLQLVKSNGEHPTFVGPLFLHFYKTFYCYNTFSSGLAGLNKNLSNILSFGTDGESALIEAFKKQCPFAIHLTCFTHCRENVKRKLRELNMPSEPIKDYILEIFGGQNQTTFIEGLADANSERDFDEKLGVLEDVWNDRERLYSATAQFFSYFSKYKAKVFKESMIKPVRKRAGLGDPPRQYHNNSPECINNVIKMKVRREKNTLDEFCSEMKSLVEQQQNHLIRAITCRGEYRLHSCFKEYEMDPSKWFQLNESSRATHIQRLRDAAIKYIKKLSNKETEGGISPSAADTSPCSSKRSDDIITEIEPYTSTTAALSQEPNTTQAKGITQTSHMSQPMASTTEKKKVCTKEVTSMIDHSLYEPIMKNTAIPHSTIQNILRKAEDLLASPNAITVAPVEGVVGRMVKSRSNPCRPHLVQVLKTGRAVCDENCLMWTSLKICSHCIAVVHCLDCASEYISWFIANSKVNLTKITTSGIGPNVGKKPSQNRYSQRKSKAPILKRVSHSSFASSEQPGVSELPFYESTSPFQVPHSSTTTFDGVFGNTYQQSGFYPNWCNYPYYSPFNVEMPNPMLAQNFSGVSVGYNSPSVTLNYNTPSSSQSHCSSQSHRYLFWVCKRNKRITTCFGCRSKFMWAADGGLPIPPLDLVLKCSESRPYYNKDGNLVEKENSNTYYHPNVSCVKKKHPEFQLTDICLDDATRSTLTLSHFELLKSVFNFRP